jgi:hypothetical protein
MYYQEPVEEAEINPIELDDDKSEIEPPQSSDKVGEGNAQQAESDGKKTQVKSLVAKKKVTRINQKQLP